MARAHSRPPPARYAVAAGFTAEKVKEGLGLAVSLIIRSDSEDSAGKGHSDSVVPPAGDECVFGVGFILLLRLAARCRGGSRRRRELRKVWDLALESFRLQKTVNHHKLAVASCSVYFRPLLRLRLGASVFFATRLHYIYKRLDRAGHRRFASPSVLLMA